MSCPSNSPAPLLELLRPAHIILEIRIAAVNDRVPSLHVLGKLLHGRFGRATGRHPNPYRARRLELGDQILER